MSYQFISGKNTSCGFECGSPVQEVFKEIIIPERKEMCSINAYAGVYNTSNTAIVLVAGAQTVIPTMGYTPNLNTTYSGNGIKIDVDGDYELHLTVTGADLATSLTAFVRRNGIAIPQTSVTKDLQLNVSTSFVTTTIVHLVCGDILDIGIQSGIAGTMLISQNAAMLTIKKLDTQVCCDCIEKYKKENGCCMHCPKASHQIKTCKDNC